MNYATKIKTAMASALCVMVGMAFAGTTVTNDVQTYGATFEVSKAADNDFAYVAGEKIANYTNDTAIGEDAIGTVGWFAGSEDDESVISNRTAAVEGLGSQYLLLNTDAETLTNKLSTADAAAVNAAMTVGGVHADASYNEGDAIGTYEAAVFESDVKFVASDTLDAGIPGGQDATKFAIYAYCNEDADPVTTNLVVFHRYLADKENWEFSFTNELFDVNIDVSEYTHLRIEMKQVLDEAAMIPTYYNVFSVTANGTTLRSDTASEVAFDDTDTVADGIWFFTTEDIDVAANKQVSSLNFKGTGEIDNIKVSQKVKETYAAIVDGKKYETWTTAVSAAKNTANVLTSYEAGALTLAAEDYISITNVQPASTSTAEGYKVVTAENDGVYTYTSVLDVATYIFLAEDGSVITNGDVTIGQSIATALSITDPSKGATAQYTYYFAGWTNALDSSAAAIATAGLGNSAIGGATYAASFTNTINTYTITWTMDDDSVIDTTTVAYGDVPTHAAPTKTATAQYTYEFTGWDTTPVAVTGTATYKATFSSAVNSYVITWTDHSGTVKTETLDYGVTPTAPTTAPAQYIENGTVYTGTWPTPASVSGTATYEANYTASGSAEATVISIADGTTTDYATLDEAIAAAAAGDTVKLLDDAAATRVIIEKNLILELGGYTYTGRLSMFDGNVVVTNGTVAGRFDVYDSSVVTLAANTTVEGFVIVWGDGTYGEAGCKSPTFNLYGTVRNNDPDTTDEYAISTSSDDDSRPTINIYDGAVVETIWAGVGIRNGATLDMTGGSITAGEFGIYNNGMDTTPTTINVSGGTVTSTNVVDSACGIYQAGPGTLTISGTAVVRGPDAVEVRAGTVQVLNNAQLIATMPYTTPASNGGGNSGHGGVALLVSQHTTTNAVSATVSGGTLQGEVAFEEATVEANAEPTKVSGTITGGTILGDVLSEDVENLIPSNSEARFADADAEGVQEGYGLKPIDGTDPQLYEVTKTYVVTYANYDGAALQVTTNFVNDATPAYAGATPVKPADASGVYAFDTWSPATNATVVADATYTATFTTTAAKATVITITGTTTNTVGYYASLAEAVSAAPAGSTIVMLANEDLSTRVTIPSGKTVTLDLNGMKLEGSLDPVIRNDGNLTIKDTVGTGKVKGTSCVRVATGSTTVFESGTFEGADGCVWSGNATSYSVTINGGAFSATQNAVLMGNGKAGNGAGATWTINGGTFTGTMDAGGVAEGYTACGIYAPDEATWTINGGTFNITDGVGILARAGSVNIPSDSTVSITTTGNTVGRVGDSRIVVPCAAVVYDTAANYPTYDSSTDKVEISGGTFVSEVTTVQMVADEGDAQSVEIPSTSTARFSDADAEGVEDGYMLVDVGGGLYGVAKAWTVAYVNYDGTELQSTVVSNNAATPAYAGETPDKADTAEYTYTFVGWAPTPDALVTSNSTYVAQFTETAITTGYTYPDGTTAIEDADQIAWIEAKGFTQTDITNLGSNEKFNECYLLNCDITAQGAGGTLSITAIQVVGSEVRVTVKLERTGAIGAINGTLYVSGTAALSSTFVDVASVTFSDDDFSEGDTTTATFTDGTKKFFKAVIK